MNSPGHRLLGLLVVVLAVGLPAGILRAACWRDVCRVDEPEAEIPFCSLGPARVLISDGWREERSPQIIAVTSRPTLAGGSAWKKSATAPVWPARDPDVFVPLAVVGPGVTGRVESGTTLDAVAPTIAALIDFHRPHPEVRSGRAVPGFASSTKPRLVLEIIVAGLGSSGVEERGWESLEKIVSANGTLEASTGSMPLDPAAVITTIGTGGLPRQHGITGTLLRNDDGRVVEAWSRQAPVSVIATLPDDLDETTRQQTKVGLVTPTLAYRGVIGGNWYLDVDRDELIVTSADRVAAATRNLLEHGYGRDDVTDVVVAVLDAGEPADIERLLTAADRVSRGAYVAVVAGTGARSEAGSIDARKVVAAVEDAFEGSDSVIAGAGPSGFFLDTAALADMKLSTRDLVEAVSQVRDDGGQMVFSDVFPEIAVAFARYC